MSPSLLQLTVSHWEPAWWLDGEALVLAALYLSAAGRLRTRWPARRTLWFLAAIASVLLALQSGIDAYDDRLLSVHMVQHMLLLLVAPLLALAARPQELLLRTLAPRRRQPVAHALARAGRLGRPVICLLVFDAVVLSTHVPSFYGAALSHPLLHAAEHALYLLAGLLLWWPVLDGDPAPSRRLGGIGRLIYMLAAMPAMALIGAYLNRHATLVYPSYGPASHALGLSALTDQAQAGAIMWVAGSVVMSAVGIYCALAALSAEERRQRLVDARTQDAR